MGERNRVLRRKVLAVRHQAVAPSPSSRWDTVADDAPQGFHNIRLCNEFRNYDSLRLPPSDDHDDARPFQLHHERDRPLHREPHFCRIDGPSPAREVEATQAGPARVRPLHASDRAPSACCGHWPRQRAKAEAHQLARDVARRAAATTGAEWGDRTPGSKEVCAEEQGVERRVNRGIGEMPLVFCHIKILG